MSLKGSSAGRQQGTSMGEAYADAQQRAGTTQQAAPQQNAAAGVPAPEVGAPGFSDSPFSIRQMQGLLNLPAAANIQSETLARMRSLLENEVKQVPDQTFDISFIGLDRENPTLSVAVSVLVCCVSIKGQKNYGVGYHAMLLQASAPEPAASVIPLGGGRTVELARTTGDAYDGIMRDEIRKEVGRVFPGVPLYSGEARVVPADFSLDDIGLVKRLKSDILTAATVALLKSMKTFKDVNLQRIEQDNTLSLHTTFNNPQLIDSVGNPIRADIRISFKAGTSRTPQGNQSQNLEKPVDVTSLAGYIDFIHMQTRATNPYVPQQQQQWVPGQASPFAQYLARFIITQLRSGPSATLGQQLLSLVMVYTLRKPGAWYPAFKPQYRMGEQHGVDLKDVGALAIETMVDPATGALGQKLNTKTDSFRPSDLGMLLGATVKPGLVVSMDIPECGDDTWMNAMFADVAAGDQKAYQTLFDATNFLTNGEFEKLFARGSMICFNENNRIQLGNYHGQDGKTDGRTLDQLGITNLMGERDIKVVRDFSATFLRSDYPIEQRLDARLNIIKQLIPDFKLTGYASRITFTDDFLQALTKAVAAAGLSVREVSPFNDTQGYDAPTYQFNEQAVGGYQPTGLFQQGYQSGPSPSQGMRTGRWS
jgi:hypothetical protein